MSNVQTNVEDAPMPGDRSCHLDGFSTEETHWGYIVRTTCNSGQNLILSQSLSLLTGAALLAAAIGMWLIPGMLITTDALFMRMFATIIFVSAASLLLWYSSRGVVSEIQIDNGRGEIREVVRNHAGRMSLLACYSFDSIGGVFMEPTGSGDAASLVLRYRNSSETVEVATGREDDLAHLRDRISRDVIVGSTAMSARRADHNSLTLAA